MFPGSDWTIMICAVSLLFQTLHLGGCDRERPILWYVAKTDIACSFLRDRIKIRNANIMLIRQSSTEHRHRPRHVPVCMADSRVPVRKISIRYHRWERSCCWSIIILNASSQHDHTLISCAVDPEKLIWTNSTAQNNRSTKARHPQAHSTILASTWSLDIVNS